MAKTNTQVHTDTLSDQDADFVLNFRARKLGVLLATANIPDDQKEAWLAMIPQMKESEIDELIDILEADFVNNATQKIDEYFSDRAQKMAEQFAKEDEETMKWVDQHMKEIESVYKKLGEA